MHSPLVRRHSVAFCFPETQAIPERRLFRNLSEVVHLDSIPASEHNFAVSPALDAMVVRVISEDPEDRPTDAIT